MEQQALQVICHLDGRLAPMSEGVLLSRDWSEQGLSSSELLRLYQRTALQKLSGFAAAQQGRHAMATWLGVSFPVVQGPMTQVSDSAPFARAVADAGAMPVIAAAMLPADRLGHILRETAAHCGDQPWGVGLLAFRSQDDLQPQIDQVLQARPDLIVLAGGNPSQISQFGDLAERVVIHSPTPELFERQLREGCRRFILEGRECGGHTGPCSSLSLWEGCLRVLASQPRQVIEETSILFAGGIQSKLSTSLIAALLEQFELGDLCHGLLVGTLTLFSQESVSTGAITPVFQDVLLKSMDTVLLETAPGHQSRCALTPFAEEFLDERRKGLEAGWDGKTLARHLDGLILGRLRLATKGLRREGSAAESALMSSTVRACTWLARLLHCSDQWLHFANCLRICCLMNLRIRSGRIHQQVRFCLGHSNYWHGSGFAWSNFGGVLESHRPTGVRSGLFQMIVGQRIAITARTDLQPRWSPGGAVLSSQPLSDWLSPTPAQVPVTEPTQILALDLVSQAINAVGSVPLTASERERTAVVFAASGGVGELGQAYTVQTALASDPERFAPWLDHLPSWTNSSFPGLLSNVTAGRVSNAFDFSGSNLLVDAACLSTRCC